jgi:hypothetical protein
MVDLKRAGERLQSARLWILHAQEAFDKKKDVRGELDLLLAQAELRRVREANCSGKWWYKYSLIRQLAALGLAVMMVTAGIGGAYFLMHRGAQQRTMSQEVVYHDILDNQGARSEDKSVEKPVQSAVDQAENKALSKVTAQFPAHQTVSREDHETAITAAHEDKPKEKALQDNKVSPDEMQKLVRVAGRTLRGQ